MEVTITCMLLLASLVLGQYGRAASPEAGGFSVDLIHRDSARSPLYDPSLSVHDRLRAAARRSNARAAALARVGASKDVVFPLVSKPFEYLMTINVGTPPRKILAIADTGSDLTWTKCAGIGGGGGGRSATDLFNPDRSSTYDVMSCQSIACRELPDATCDTSGICKYLYSYGDGSQTSGDLATETFSFDDAAGARRPQVRVPNVTFGCSTTSTGTFNADGLVGLGGGADSLVTQLGDASFGRRFSYCLAPYSSNSTVPSGLLHFGSNAVVSEPDAVTTPMVTPNVGTFYIVALEAVKLGGRTVSSHLSRVIVDSGTTLTLINPAILTPLTEALRRQIRLPPVQPPDQSFELCYKVDSEQQQWQEELPDLVFQFRGAPVTLQPVNTFVLVEEGKLCLAITPAPPGEDGEPISIIGNIAQQNFHVGYDLDRRTVTFAAKDCTIS